MEYCELVQILKESGGWSIFGSGIVAYNVYIALLKCYNISPSMIIVSKIADKEPFFEKEIIYNIDELDCDLVKNTPIIVATPVLYHTEIQDALNKRNFNKVILVDDSLFYDIMTDYFAKYKNILIFDNVYKELLDRTNYNTIKHNFLNKIRDLDCKVYMAKWHGDRQLSRSYNIYDYIVPICVGAQNTPCGKKNELLADNTGDNISDKNPNYCELTATYWVWKNTRHDIKGICHYRRMLLADEEKIKEMIYAGVDAILPLPYICRNSIKDQYSRYIEESDIYNLFKAINDVYPEELERSKKILHDKYIYNYNMLIARKEIYDDYCEWLFGVLKRAEYYCDRYNTRKDRYAGYLGELLTTFYFIRNADKIKIAHCDRIWMI